MRTLWTSIIAAGVTSVAYGITRNRRRNGWQRWVPMMNGDQNFLPNRRTMRRARRRVTRAFS